MAPRNLSATRSDVVAMPGKCLWRATLLAVALALVGAPQIRAQSAPASSKPLPSFEVASVRLQRGDRPGGPMWFPGRFRYANGPVKDLLVRVAYNVYGFQISGGPSWINSEIYSIDAKEPDSLAEEMQKLPIAQQEEIKRLLVQSLLADRFKLRLHRETRMLPVYALVIAKDGPKLHEAKPGDTYPNGMRGPDGRAGAGAIGEESISKTARAISGQGISIAPLVPYLSREVKRTVLDQTGLKGKYDIRLEWNPDLSAAGMVPGPEDGKPGTASAPPPESSMPSIFTALQEQLGLKLVSTKGPVEILVIDHIEMPSEY